VDLKTKLKEALLFESLLGTAMRRGEIMDELTSFGFGIDDIDNEVHRHIWRIAHDLRSKGQPADPAVVEALMLAQDVDADTVREFIGSCLKGSAADVETGRVRPFVDMLRQRVALRRMSDLGRSIMTETAREGVTASAIASRAAAEMDRISGAVAAIGGATGKDLAAIAREQIHGGGIKLVRHPTHISNIDRLTRGGIPEGTIFLLGARSGIGKSTYARYVTVENARRGVGVLYFSTEMPRGLVAGEFVSQICGVEMPVDGEFRSPDQHSRLAQAVATLDDMPIFFEDQTGLTVEDITTKIHKYKRDHDIKMVVIDYAQGIEKSAIRVDRDSLHHEHISRRLRECVQDAQVSMLLMCQLRPPDERSRTKNADELPSDSEMYLKDASGFAVIWRDKNNDDQTIRNLSAIKLRKNRYGAGRLGEGHLFYDGARLSPSDHRGNVENAEMPLPMPPPQESEDSDAPF